MHTLVLVFILIELSLTRRNYPSRKFGVTAMVVFTTSYMIVLNTMGFKNGLWVYPVLDAMNWSLRMIFFAVSIGFGVGTYFVGEKLNDVVSSEVSKEFKSKSKLKY